MQSTRKERRTADPAVSADDAGTASQSVASARRVLDIESAALAQVSRRLDARFDRAVEILEACRGKVVVVGMGKSGIICRKIAATLASTGTPASFLHAAEAVHGDFGVVGTADVLLALSYSGETEEMVRLLPLVKRFALPLIAITGSDSSTLSMAADVALDAGVPEEACPMGLAPTASTTAALALGDALAVALLERKGFGESDFAVLHPAGSLGRKLLKVADVMHTGDQVPLVGPQAALADTLLEITQKRLGVTGVVDDDGRLVGIITDGDLRRGLTRRADLADVVARDLMTDDPRTIEPSALAARALGEMERASITSLFIVEPETGRAVGIVHLHDLLKAGVT
jgi:arabinose-5-phosphate isomerase